VGSLTAAATEFEKRRGHDHRCGRHQHNGNSLADVNRIFQHFSFDLQAFETTSASQDALLDFVSMIVQGTMRDENPIFEISTLSFGAAVPIFSPLGIPGFVCKCVLHGGKLFIIRFSCCCA
jgi:hypothetical protein